MAEEIDFKARAREIYGETYIEPIYYRRILMAINSLNELTKQHPQNIRDIFHELWVFELMSDYGSLCDPRICPENEFNALMELIMSELENLDVSSNDKSFYKDMFKFYFLGAKSFRKYKNVNLDIILGDYQFDNKTYKELQLLSNPVLDKNHLEYWGYEWWKQ